MKNPFWLAIILAASGMVGPTPWLNKADAQTFPYDIQLDVIHQGFDQQTCWVHPRAGIIPGPNPIGVLTMQKLWLKGSDVFFALNEMRTEDLKHWSEPKSHDATLGRRNESNDVVVCVCDFTPQWHAATKTLLGTGQTVRYQNSKVMDVRRREVAYSIYDPTNQTWMAWETLVLPQETKFENAGSGSGQRYDEANGDILLPIYFKEPKSKQYSSAVVRCHFDGVHLTYVEHGSEHTLAIDRGLYEPSVTKYKDYYYLTLRNDQAGYMTRSQDGLHYEEPRMWLFDDGTPLGNYNTQQHWVTHDHGLFLVYTRRGANNDHVFRHRAPLFIAQVNPERGCVIRSTERILVPEKGARLGNFGITQVNQHETWVTVAEWMQTTGPNPYDFTVPMKYGADNRVYVARILWAD